MGSQDKVITPTTVAFYPVPAVLYFVFLYISAKVTELSLSKIARKRFTELSFEQRRNTVGYVLNVFWTTTALALQLAASPIMAEKYTVERFDLVRVAALIISGLYIFEMTYRPSLRTPILIHHFCTLFAIILIVCVLQRTLHPALGTLGLLWIFHASTEQPIFVALIMYRLRCCSKRTTKSWLYFSAVQSLIFKFGISIYLFIWWGLKLSSNHEMQLDKAFSVLFVLTLSALMVTQGYGSWAVWRIARGMDRKDSEKKGNTEASSESMSPE